LRFHKRKKKKKKKKKIKKENEIELALRGSESPLKERKDVMWGVDNLMQQSKGQK